jgi:hypothetical protein
MATEIEDWQIADAVVSYYEAICIIGERYKAGEAIPAAGYFARGGVPRCQRPDTDAARDNAASA